MLRTFFDWVSGFLMLVTATLVVCTALWLTRDTSPEGERRRAIAQEKLEGAWDRYKARIAKEIDELLGLDDGEPSGKEQGAKE